MFWVTDPERDVDPGVVLRTTVELDGATAVVTVAGEVDMHTAPRLTAALREALTAGPEILVIDFTAVTFLASSGLAALLDALSEARRRSCLLRLVGESDAVRRPLEITGLARLFPR